MDKISIKRLEVFGNHGELPAENELGQKFLISADLYTDLSEAGKTDDLTYSVNYAEVCRFIYDTTRKTTFRLIERLAGYIAEELLVKYESLERIVVRVEKPWAPVQLPLETVAVTIDRSWHEVYLSTGSNMGDRKKYIDLAVSDLKSDRKIRVIKASDITETDPYGYEDQGKFLNGALLIKTLYSPEELLKRLHETESKLGRVRKVHWGPRTIDLDILFYDDIVLDSPDLTIPHPDMQNRMFVLLPLSEIAPHKVHPVLLKSVWALKTRLEGDNEK